MTDIKKNKILISSKEKTGLMKNKFKALFIHLLSSITFISAFMLLIYFLWFPEEVMKLTGISKIFMTLVAIDIIIGPLLTYIVYNPKKKSLKFDLSTIVVLQLAAFSYGAYTIYQAHPVYITYTVDRFSLVSARDANPQAAAFDEYKVSTLGRPVLAYAQSPDDPDKRNELLMSVVMEGALDLDARAEYYKPYNENIEHIIQRSFDPELLFTTSAELEHLNTYLRKYSLDALAFLPIQGKANSMVYVLEKATGTPLGMIDIDPWEKLSKSKSDKQRSANNLLSSI